MIRTYLALSDASSLTITNSPSLPLPTPTAAMIDYRDISVGLENRTLNTLLARVNEKKRSNFFARRKSLVLRSESHIILAIIIIIVITITCFRSSGSQPGNASHWHDRFTNSHLPAGLLFIRRVRLASKCYRWCVCIERRVRNVTELTSTSVPIYAVLAASGLHSEFLV